MLRASENQLPVSGGVFDRRSNDRFPIIRDVRYKVLSSRGKPEAGTGKTIDVSSGGVLLSTEAPLAPGKRVELSISWPAQLDGKCALKLVARGRVTRCLGMEVAVEIDKYEFRTQGSLSRLTKA